MVENFQLIAITSERNIVGEINDINALFDAGLPLLHIRKPGHTSEEVKNMLNAIPGDFHPKIVIHSHYELLRDFNLKGAHLPEEVRKKGELSGIRKIVSTSFHNIGDIVTEKMNFEYIFFSPVFQSISKKGYLPAIEPEAIKAFFNSTEGSAKPPIIALGGITDATILQARDMGFQGAAFIGYIWEHHDPVAQLKKLQAILQA